VEVNTVPYLLHYISEKSIIIIFTITLANVDQFS